MRKRMRFASLIIILLVTVTSAVGNPVAAQNGQPPTTPSTPDPCSLPGEGNFSALPGKSPAGSPNRPGDGLNRLGDGLNRPEGGTPAQDNQPLRVQTIGGPDDFGYTFDDSVSFDWIDATSGTDTGMSGESGDQAVGPVSLPFPFRFYDGVYDQLWIAASGYLAFTDNNGTWPEQQSPFPSTDAPNNLIAPFWTVMSLQGSGPSGRVYYLSGGDAPDRYFVAEWYDVAGGIASDPSGGDETYRFEAILYENGDILFQYQAMTYNDWRYFASIGIEDAQGAGLGFMDWSNYWDVLPIADQAVRFYRPIPAARVALSPLYSGAFVRSGESQLFEFTVQNTGDLGADTYDLAAASAWPVTLYDQQNEALTDTDGDGLIDSGSIQERESKTILARIQTPVAVNVGDSNTAAITVTSSIDPTKSEIATLRAAVPAPFAQIYSDGKDGVMSLALIKPDSRVMVKTTSDDYYGYDMSVAGTSGFAMAWTKYSWLGDFSVSDIEYTLLNGSGNVTRAVTQLTNNSSANMTAYDYPSIAVAPDGSIGVLWYRYYYNDSTYMRNDNIWFSVLDKGGHLVFPPTNLTANGLWGDWSMPGFYSFDEPHITATRDNRFLLTWTRQSAESGGTLYDIYYAIRDSRGNAIKPITKLTNGVADNDWFYSPTATPLANNRILLAYYNYSSAGATPYLSYFAVLDSAGNVVKPQTSTGIMGWRPDAVQLSDGRLLIAASVGEKIEFVTLNGSTYDVISGPATLDNPAADCGGDGYVSVTADSAGGGILTWTNANWNQQGKLYYALVNGDGAVLTPPMIFYTAQQVDWGNPYVVTSYSGYGNTAYAIPASGEGVDAYIQGDERLGAAPGGPVSIPIEFGNLGKTTAESILVSAVLAPGLTYVSDTSGVAPVQSGNELTWSIPTDLRFLGNGKFTLVLEAPDGPYGAQLPVTVQISSAGADSNPGNNTFEVEVLVAYQSFLPALLK
jgi:hypothetical protein